MKMTTAVTPPADGKRGVKQMIIIGTILGLPLKTMGIIGGLFLLSAAAPTLVALILKIQEDQRDE